jgi:glyoxylase-like metal-dependent hydrolase (beta-lactamase superfamily II)
MSLLVDRVIAPYYQTNCWIIAPSAGSECILVDPGIAIPSLKPAIDDVLNRHSLRVGGVIITHGHLDHTFSLISKIEDFVGIDCYVHEADRDLLSFPERAMGPQSQALVTELKSASLIVEGFQEPDSTFAIKDGERINLGEMSAVFHHAPGHTPGSILVTINEEILVSGDVLFKGSIGRTDLPRGSLSDMERTLREKIATQPTDLRVLTGHGEETTIDEELRTNRYLKAAQEGRLGES